MIRTFKEIKKEEIDIVGGKGANLGELTGAGFDVPPGFVVTTSSYFAFIKQNKLDGKIDILTVFLVTLSLYLFIRNKLTASAITLALGIVFRFYPIILIPLYLIFLPSRKIKSMVAFLSPIILILGSGALVLQKLTGSGFIENVSALILSGNKEFLWFFGHTFTSLIEITSS